MRIAVIGGAGFVGRHLNSALVQRGHEVLVYDDLSARKGTVDSCWMHSLQICRGELRDGPGLQAVLTSFRPDLIYHLAALHFIPYCDAHPRETFEVNVAGTLNLMLAAQQLPQLGGIVFASSVAVYAATDAYHGETDQPQPCDIYGLTKVLGEQVVDLYARKARISHISARLANIYGPDETSPHVIPTVLEQLLSGVDVLHLGRTDLCRDFLYVEDLVEALTAAIPILLREEIHETVNLGPGEESRVQDAIDILCQLVGRDVRQVVDEGRLRTSERAHLRACREHALDLLGWTPKHELRAGLEKTFACEQGRRARPLALLQQP